MPLREFGGRAAGGALGLQHGNVLTDALGNIAVVFAVPFGGVPNVVANVLDALNNYYVVVRTVNALGFTAQARRTQTGLATPNGVWADVAGGGVGVNVYVVGVQGGGLHGLLSLTGNPDRTLTHTHGYDQDSAAAAGVSVMWMAAA